MHRIFAILLICLLPLQSFASGVMGVKMASMEISMKQMQMADSAQAPCHEASQPTQATDQDCCGSQGICLALCQMMVVLSVSIASVSPSTSIQLPAAFAAAFQSAPLTAPQKPPIL